MATTDPSELLHHYDLILRPDPSRTVIRPFAPGDPAGFVDDAHPRAQRIVDRVLDLDDAMVHELLRVMTESLDDRHRHVDELLLRRFDEVTRGIADCGDPGDERKRLIGAYFSEEFSFEAAALFNPSIVKHVDQSGVPDGGVRFVMSLRGIGEGHVSSVTFRIGTWVPGGALVVEQPSANAVPPRIEPIEGEDGAMRLICDDAENLSETVLFPVAPSQRQGIEDVRLVNFVDDDGEVSHLGTYTAFSGSAVRSELFRAQSFNCFEMRPMRGVIAESKGTAIFPRKVGGRYMMLSRHDNESVWLLSSDDLYEWQGGARLISPRFAWEYVQVGNCGSPIELDEGWLVITHGVGVVRNYCVGLCLLDRDDPSKVLKRLHRPLLHPSANERDGYVPNVVYSCGAIVHERTLLLPYGVADNFTAFASVAVDELLDAME